ncbi:hypothetical protein NPIL_203951 [Nephila pilipes]|uniref:Uncharacterized protein n=1 Tax=Nephila pilipes TaxID=299642 RepID=A0A8X6P7R0_NEPPI|nr:hypothetical protein NPIL_203951 [Nephila pilipes]
MQQLDKSLPPPSEWEEEKDREMVTTPNGSPNRYWHFGKSTVLDGETARMPVCVCKSTEQPSYAPLDFNAHMGYCSLKGRGL